jgi:hypothetical protein
MIRSLQSNAAPVGQLLSVLRSRWALIALISLVPGKTAEPDGSSY